MIKKLFINKINFIYLLYLGIESFNPINTIPKDELSIIYDETNRDVQSIYKYNMKDNPNVFYSSVFIGDTCKEIYVCYRLGVVVDKETMHDHCKYKQPYIINKCDLNNGTIRGNYTFGFGGFRLFYTTPLDPKIGGINYTVFVRTCNASGINRYFTGLIVLKPYKLKCVNVEVLDPELFFSKIAINVSWSKKYTIKQVFRFDIILIRNDSCILYININVNNIMEPALNKPLPNLNMSCSVTINRKIKLTLPYFMINTSNDEIIPLENLTTRVIPINVFGEGCYENVEVKAGKYFSGPAVNVTVNENNGSVSWHDPVHPGGLFGGYYFYILVVKQNITKICICLKKINFTISKKNKLDCAKLTHKTLEELYETVVVTEKDMINGNINLLNNDMFLIAPFNDYGLSNATHHTFIRIVRQKSLELDSKISDAESSIYLVLILLLIPGLIFVFVARDKIFHLLEKAINTNERIERKSQKISTGSEISEIIL